MFHPVHIPVVTRIASKTRSHDIAPAAKSTAPKSRVTDQERWLKDVEIMPVAGKLDEAPPANEISTKTEVESEEDQSIQRRINDQPTGYPRLATFLDCDENFMIFRRFGYLQMRLLLEKQDELRRLELELDVMEARQADQNDQTLRTRRRSHNDPLQEKAKLLENIEVMWTEYASLLWHASRIVALEKPSDNARESLSSFFWNTEAVATSEQSFVRHQEDLITLKPIRRHAWIRSSVEQLLQRPVSRPLRWFFRSHATVAKSDGNSGEVLLTRSRIEAFVTLVAVGIWLVIVCILLLLIHMISSPLIR